MAPLASLTQVVRPFWSFQTSAPPSSLTSASRPGSAGAPTPERSCTPRPGWRACAQPEKELDAGERAHQGVAAVDHDPVEEHLAPRFEADELRHDQVRRTDHEHG